MLYFVFSIQRIPFSQAILLSFTIPPMASIMARIILHEKLKIAEIGGQLTFSHSIFTYAIKLFNLNCLTMIGVCLLYWWLPLSRSCLQFLWHAFHFSADAYYTRYRSELTEPSLMCSKWMLRYVKGWIIVAILC